MKKLITTCSAIVLILAAYVPVHATPIPSNALAGLLVPGATITSGDKVFSNFTWTSTAVSPNDVAVVPYNQVVLGELEYGLQFFTPTVLLNAAGGLSATMTYNVTPNIPGRLISDNTLAMVAAGNGVVSVVEIPTDAAGVLPLLTIPKHTDRQGGFDIGTFDHQDYLNPVVSVNVQTLINLAWAGGAAGTGPQLRSFTQTFSQTPEPATLALAGMCGLFGAAVFLRRRWG